MVGGNFPVVSGRLVLQGGAPFVGNDDLDRRLVQGLRGPVAVLPTADAFEGPEKMIEAAAKWGERLGVKVHAVEVYSRASAMELAHADALRLAAAVWVVGDSPIHLRSCVKDTPVFDALAWQATHGLLVAAAGSAAALCDPMVDPRGGAFALGLGLVTKIALITESEQWSKDRLQRSLDLANTTVVEVPTGSALERTSGEWKMHGDVTVHGDLPN
jgi:cyanophycinase